MHFSPLFQWFAYLKLILSCLYRLIFFVFCSSSPLVSPTLSVCFFCCPSHIFFCLLFLFLVSRPTRYQFSLSNSLSVAINCRFAHALIFFAWNDWSDLHKPESANVRSGHLFHLITIIFWIHFQMKFRHLTRLEKGFVWVKGRLSSLL